MAANYNAQLVGGLGATMAENPTGVMQEAGFREVGLNWRYLNIEVPPDKLADAVTGVRAFGMQGFNLTIPHKVAVIPLLDEVMPDAAMIGAVNTVRREGDRLIGENTDGKGFLRGLREQAGVDPKGKRVVMLGAGGAARAIATELALAGASEIVVVNRSSERGEGMVGDLRSRTGANVQLVGWSGTYRVPASTDIFVNATSIGLFPDVDAMPPVNMDDLKSGTLVCDVVFNPPETPFLRTAKQHGLPTLDGLSMLVYQGVIGFELWTGQKAPEAVMKKALAEALGV